MLENEIKQKERQKQKFQEDLIKLLVFLFTLLMIFLIIHKIKTDTNKETIAQNKIDTILQQLDKTNTVSISKYIVYGTHFNIEGTLELPKISGITVSSANIVAKTIDDTEIIIKSDYTYKDGKLSFSTSEKINSGIDLESLSNTSYYLSLKVTFSNSDIKYYGFTNATEYQDITYYTITKNNSNNKVKISFDKYNDTSFMKIDVSDSSLPEDVYDIVIDPGHGGTDVGAVSGDYNEANITLAVAIKLKLELENLGLKVLMTRDTNTPKEALTAYSMYDENGRVSVTARSSAKLMLSLHLNSNTTNVQNGGLEIYAPSNCDLDFATLLAQNIVSTSGTSYSQNSTYKKADGVYVRNYNKADILAAENIAKKSGYEPYNITTSTPYLYMIREIGGIATNAFVDGRNKSYGENKYRNSNVGVEGYLIELGYMVIQEDLNNIINNSELYVKGIAQSISDFYLQK